MPVKVNSTGGGSVTIDVPSTAANNTLTLPARTGTAITSADSGTISTAMIADANVTPAKLSQPLTLATAQNTTSGTSIDFTGIPSWAKRITVMFNGVSTNGTSLTQLQVGSGSVTTSGYTSGSNFVGASIAGNTTSSTTGLLIDAGGGNAANLRYGHAIITLLGNNTWVESFTLAGSISGTNYLIAGGGVSPALSGALDRVRLTTVNGTDTFDAGSVNILYEG